MAYDSIDPIGKHRDDYGWAMLCSMVYNLALDIYVKKGEHPKRTTPKDFMPDWGNPKGYTETSTQSVEEQKAILLQLARSHNKAMKNRKGNNKHG